MSKSCELCNKPEKWAAIFGHERKFGFPYLFARTQFFEDGKIKAKYCPLCGRDLQENPLTIDELQQMEGEIVFCTPMNDWAKITPYGFIYFGTEQKTPWKDLICSYSEKWLAYKQRPRCEKK